MKGRLSSRAWAAEEAIVPNTGLPCAYCHCPHRRAPTASPRPRTSLPSASITWETAVGVMFRRPSLWTDTIQQKKTAGAIITMGQKLPGMPTKPGYTNAAPSMTSAPTVPVTKNTLRATRYITCTSRYRRSDTLADTMRDTAMGKPAMAMVYTGR